LIHEAKAAEARQDVQAASQLYKRASVVYRIARFPIISSPAKEKAWASQKQVYLKAASFWDAPITEHIISHTQASGADAKEIPIYVRLPPGASSTTPCPAILLITGLDGHRPDNTVRTDEFLQRGWASVIAEIPGTGDCPAEKNDAQSPDRLWSSILDWMQGQGSFNMKKIIAWGLSAGGYYAIRFVNLSPSVRFRCDIKILYRAAHTHKDRLAGACGQGAGTHHFLGREWLDQCDNHEYPFNLTPALGT
jgi:hypothetical protein